MNKKYMIAGILLLLFVLFAPCSSDGGVTYQYRGIRGCGRN